MADNNMNAASFADRISVPRSGLSHVLKGRNKASLDYIQKILEVFPNIDSNWLLTGKESNIPGSSVIPENIITTDMMSSMSHVNKRIEKNRLEMVQEVMPDKEVKNNAKNQKSDDSYNKEDKSIDRIVVFYQDGSFKSYRS